MRILLINHYAGSPELGMEFRPYYLAKGWAKQGHEVLIVGASYSHLRKSQPQAAEQTIDGINYHWLKTNTYNGNGLGRILSMFLFVYKLYLKAHNLAKKFRPDIVINSSTYPLDIYPAHKIAKIAKAKLIFEVHDLWPLSPMEIGGYSKNHPFIWVMQQAENYAYKHCDKVISLLDKAYIHMEKHGLQLKKFHCIPNGYSEEEWKSNFQKIPESARLSLQKLHQQNKFIIGYAGGHSASNALDSLIDAANLLKDKEQIIFVLVGNGVLKDKLQEKVKDLELNNVHFLPSVNKNEIPDLMSYIDVGYMGGIKSTLHYFGTSFNKMTDYMLAGKPIIFSSDEQDTLIERVGCGIAVPAENVQQIKTAILNVYTLTNEERIRMGEKGRIYAVENLEYEILAKRMVQKMTEC